MFAVFASDVLRIYIKPSKCKFYSESVVWLGWQIQSTGVSISPEKSKALMAIPIPITAAEHVCDGMLKLALRKTTTEQSTHRASLIGVTWA